MNLNPLPRRRTHDILATALFGLLMWGCGSPSETFTFKDQGKICALPGGQPPRNPFETPSSQIYLNDAPLELQVVMPRCLSSSCSHDAKASCTATVTGNVIQVTSGGSVREQGDTCTADCGALVARCVTGPLPAGTYEVRHGATTLALTVPSTTTTPCGGMGVGAPVTPR